MTKLERLKKIQQEIPALIDAHSSLLKKGIVQREFKINSKGVLGVLGHDSDVFIPVLIDVWKKLNSYCVASVHSKSSYMHVAKTTLLRQVLKPPLEMHGDLLVILNDLTMLSKNMVARVCNQLVLLLEEDENFFSALGYKDSALEQMRELSEKMSDRQVERVTQLTADEAESMLSITTRLHEKGIVTEYYGKHIRSSRRSYAQR
jgi:hypothetical protein